MKIDQALVDSTGRVLIEKGAFLDDFQIEYLQTNVPGGIYVAEGEPDEDELNQVFISEFAQKEIENNRKPDPKKVELTQEVKKRVSEGIQYLFDNTTGSDFAEKSESVAGELMTSILDSDAVAFDINTLKVSDVAAMSLVIGKNLGLSREDLKELGVAGLLHDVGKSSIPKEILNKPGKLTDEEFVYMKQHSLFGLKILKERGGFSNGVLNGVMQHHEKMSGRGYPQGVPAERIHRYARIISVADVYDALVTKRPYKDGFPKSTAVEMIMAMTEDLDNDVMKSFLDTVVLYPEGSFVTLSNGELCKVVANNKGYPLRPKVVSIKTGRLHDLSCDLDYASMTIPQN